MDPAPFRQAPSRLVIVSLGGTIDKKYSTVTGALYFGGPFFAEIAHRLRLSIDWELVELARKDSNDLDDEDLAAAAGAIEADAGIPVVVTVGTDAMVRTARTLRDLLTIPASAVVVTGAFRPGRYDPAEAAFNLGSAMMAASLLPVGVYIVMGGEVLDPAYVVKDAEMRLFRRSEGAE